MNLQERCTVAAFRAAWFLMPRISEHVTQTIFDVLADVAWLRNGSDVRRLQSNLARVTGADSEQEQRDLTRRAMRSYARYWRETFSLDGWSLHEMQSRVRYIGIERLDAAMESGGGALLAATHSGNWDLAAVVIAHRYGGGTTVAERLKPEALFDLFVAARTKYGVEIIPHAGGKRPAFAVLLERARAGRLLALVSDRDLSHRGVDVQFFGANARMAGGPGALALATGIPVFPVAIWNDGAQLVFEVKPQLDVVEGDTVATFTQRLADAYADIIGAHPEDWHMLQRVWIEATV